MKIKRSLSYLSLRSVFYELNILSSTRDREKRPKKIPALQDLLCLNMKTNVVYHLREIPEVLLRI